MGNDSKVASELSVKSSGSDKNVTYSFVCPHCAGTSNMFEMDFICEDCSKIFELNACALPDISGNNMLDTKALINNLVTRDIDSMFVSDIHVTNGNNNTSVTYGGEVYKTLIKVQNTYGFKSTEDVIRAIFEGFMIFFKAIEECPSGTVHLIDSKGNKSPNLKGMSYFRAQSDQRQKDDESRILVEKFIFEMQKAMAVWKHRYNGSQKNKS